MKFENVSIAGFSSFLPEEYMTTEAIESKLDNVYKKLKDGGLFFSYFPSKASDAFQFPGESTLIDQDTLNSISRIDSPFCGQNYPFRFTHPREYELELEKIGFKIQYSEKVTRTYSNHNELFEFIVIEAKKV